jgi:hypothetical protein
MLLDATRHFALRLYLYSVIDVMMLATECIVEYFAIK